MKKLAIVTATRAEYGLLAPIIRKVNKDDEMELDLIVTGAHLVESQGYTINEIIKDGFPIAYRIPILEEGNTSYDVSIAIANAIKGFAKCFRDDRPDMVVILGDRTEMLGVASAAMNERIPIAHIHGGELTEGAVDDCVRHCLTKMSYLHFTTTETYRKRVIQLGENPNRVFNVGSVGVENALGMRLLEKSELEERMQFNLDIPYAVVTFHPTTLEDGQVEEQFKEILGALDKVQDMKYVFTKANVDVDGEIINKMIDKYVEENTNAVVFESLGTLQYLSALKYASMVIGNSSSGLIEVPSFKIPTINIGDRQKGRLQAESVINCEPKKSDVYQAICFALSEDFQNGLKELRNPYGNGDTSRKIVKILRENLLNEEIILKKKFYDVSFEEE